MPTDSDFGEEIEDLYYKSSVGRVMSPKKSITNDQLSHLNLSSQKKEAVAPFGDDVALDDDEIDLDQMQ